MKKRGDLASTQHGTPAVPF